MICNYLFKVIKFQLKLALYKITGEVGYACGEACLNLSYPVIEDLTQTLKAFTLNRSLQT